MKMNHLLKNHWWIILLGIIGLIFITFILGNIQMNRKISRETEMLMETTEKHEPSTIKEKELAGLPEPVQKWLRTSGVIGKERIRSIRISQRGEMKLDPKQDKWLKPEAELYVRVDEPGYLWHVDLPMIPLLNVKGRDLFHEGEGVMEIRIGSLIPVVNEKSNDKLNESSLHRFLLEMPWYPTAALEDYMTWEAVDEHSAKGILTYKGITVDAMFYFGGDGRLLRQETLRFKENNEEAERLPCIGEVKGYKEFNGFNIPNRYNVTWMMDGEPFTWYKLENYAIDII